VTVPAEDNVPAVIVAPSTLVIVPSKRFVTVPAEDNVPAVMVAPSTLVIVPSKRFVTVPAGIGSQRQVI
ncbi:hypothetical protein, partial [Paenibacillus camerounensis]|uniref:hypothetical protein n=1 Tax=Paenibacillus camerounensis TaxID=1243663 RepID=UPI0005AAED72